MNGIVTLLSEQMLQLRVLILAAIMQHYGWKRQGNEYVKGDKGRDFRVPTDTLRIKRADLFERRYVGDDREIELFTRGEVNNPFVSNFKQSTLPAEKFYVIVGIQLRSANGAANATVDTLAFDTITEAELLNGLIEFEINGANELDREPVDSKFINGDVVPNFFRFPKPIVWEPNQGMQLRIKLPASFDTATENKWVEAKLVGYMLEK